MMAGYTSRPIAAIFFHEPVLPNSNAVASATAKTNNNWNMSCLVSYCQCGFRHPTACHAKSLSVPLPRAEQTGERLQQILLQRSEEHTSELQSLRHLVC